MKRQHVALLISLVVAVGLLAWVLHDVSAAGVWQSLQGLRYPWLGLGLATLLASYAGRAYRWGILLADSANAGSFTLRQGAIYVGYAANQILPGNVGEVLRAAILSRGTELPLATVLGSLVVARFFDAVAALLLLLAPLAVPAFTPQAASGLPLLGLGAILAAVAVALWVASHMPNQLARGVGRLARLVGLGRFESWLTGNLGSLLGGLSAFRSPRQLIRCLAATLVIWLLSGVTFWSALEALRIQTPGFPGALFVQSLQAVGSAIPSAPGHLGPFEAAIRLGLGAYEVPPDPTLAYMLVLRALMQGSVLIVGATYVLLLGISPRALLSRSRRETGTAG
jgi:uncharacterized protein (TIRG00374 family)